MKFFVVWFSVVFAQLLLRPAPVFAAEPPVESMEYTFTDETVVGELPGVEGVSISVRGKAKEKSLIRVKTHFVYEMLKSVETM